MTTDVMLNPPKPCTRLAYPARQFKRVVDEVPAGSLDGVIAFGDEIDADEECRKLEQELSLLDELLKH